MLRKQLADYLAEFLQLDKYTDYAPNGLQVEGRNEIHHIVTGVSACQPLIDKAIEKKADAILVHHGFFWKNEPSQILGMKKRRIKSLLVNEVNLFGYHLPLDGHISLGNNAMLAKKLGIISASPIDGVAQGLVWRGVLPQTMTCETFSHVITTNLGREPLFIGDPNKGIKDIAWCTGGAQDYIDIAYEYGADAFITGEVSERTFHAAMEQDIAFFSAGHHATETYGIQALGEHLAEKFGLTHEFINVTNPV